MPSDDHTERFDHLTILESITDPTGTTYEWLGGAGGATRASVRVTGDAAAGTYTAADTADGSTIDSGSNPTTVLDSAVAALPDRSGTERHATLAIQGTFSLPSRWTVDVPWTHVDARGAYVETTGDSNVLRVAADHCRVTGGVYDGHQQTTYGTDDSTYRYVVEAGGQHEDISLDGLRVVNGGRYGVNLYDVSNVSLTNSAVLGSHTAAVHNGADTQGWGSQIRVQNVLAVDTETTPAFDDRGTTDASTRITNTFENCWSVNVSGTNGGGFAVQTHGPPSSQVTLRNCHAVAPGSEPAFWIANGDHVLTACGAYEPSGAGFQPNSNGVETTVTLRNCVAAHAGTVGFYPTQDVTVHADGCRFGTHDFSSLGSEGRVVARNCDIPEADSSEQVWVDGYAGIEGAPDPTAFAAGIFVEDTVGGRLYAMGDTTRYEIGTTDPDTLVIDSFESGSVALDNYTGETAEVTVTDTTAAHGQYALEHPSTNTAAVYADAAAFPTTPQAGDTIRFNVQFQDPPDGFAGFGFARQDTQDANSYQVRVRPGLDALQTVKWTDGGHNQLNSTTGITYEAGVWYEGEIEWATGGGFSTRLYDESGSQVGNTISTSDDEWTSGNFYWNTNSICYVDNLRISR